MKLTKEQAIIVSAYTGCTAINFGFIQQAVEKKLGHPVWTHEFANQAFIQKVQDAFREDFLEICYTEDWFNQGE